MRFKKIIACLLAFSLLIAPISAVPVFAGTAEGIEGPAVYLEDFTLAAGKSKSTSLYCNNFEKLGAGELSLYYNEDVFTVSGSYAQTKASGASVSFDESTPGQAHMYFAKADGVSGSGAFWGMTIKVNAAAPVGTHRIRVVVGECYNTDLAPVSVAAVDCIVAVTESTTTAKKITFSANSDNTLYKKGEKMEVKVSTSSAQGLASGDFEFYYDRDHLTLDSAVLGTKMTGANGSFYSVNDKTAGYVKISYASLTEVTGSVNPFLTMTFTVMADMDGQTEMIFRPSNLSDSKFETLDSQSLTILRSLEKTPEVVVPQYPTMSVTAVFEEQSDSVVAVINLGENSNLGAGDFTLKFDPSILAVSSYEQGFSADYFYVNEKNFSKGEILFSILSMEDITSAEKVLTITFRPAQSCSPVTCDLILSGKSVTDSMVKPITLAYSDGSVTVPAHHTYDSACDPTCNLCPFTREPLAPHTYDNDCDTICNACGTSREVPHFYDNACDAVCNECNEIRTPPHSYDNVCDTDCNDCGSTREAPHDYGSVCDTTCDECGITREVPHVYDNIIDTDCNECGDIRVLPYDSYGTTGECYWYLVGTRLTITGNGKMGTYSSGSSSAAPWGKAITEVVIENGVTSIGNYAFYNCSKLTSVTIPGSVTAINTYAFGGCSALISITIPDGVTTIGTYAFYNCSNLTSLAIPKSVTSIGDYVFRFCSALTSFTVEKGNAVYHSAGNCIIKTASKTLIAGCNASVIPDDGSVTAIGNYAFYNCSKLTSVTIPDGVTTIGSSAFSGCSALTSITIPKSVTSIGTYAFQSCSALTSLTVEECNAVYHSAGNCIIETASKTVVAGCNTSVIPNDGSVTAIGNYAFYYCSNLGTVTIPDSVTTIGNYAFYCCSSLGTVTIPDSVTTIGNYAFSNCSGLTSITIPDSVTTISERVFYGCSKLTSVNIPHSVTTIGPYAFYSCSKLTNVWYEGTEEEKAAISIASSNTPLTKATWHYVDSTCDTICSKCNATRETLEPHTYDNDCDTVCNVCSTPREVPHFYDNACDTTCDECGCVREITHDYSVQDKNAESHWMKCSVCGVIDEDSREVHGYDNNCDTDCNICGHTRTITHDYSVQDKDAESHWMKCSVCGTIDETTREAHGYDNNCDTTCDHCGYVRSITHDYSMQDKNADTHWMKCSVCGEIDETTREAHIHDNACDTTCNVCGQVRTITHDYSIQDKNAETHWMKCSVCGVIDETTRKTHGYDNTCDTTCDHCGYVRSITHDYSMQDKNATHHFMKCSVCGTIDEDSRETHGYENNCDTTCDECGYERTITHDYSVQDKNTETHWMKCSVCGTIDETSREKHYYTDNCDPYCNSCGYQRTITHNYSTLLNSEFLHWYNCSVCGATDDTSYEEHLYDHACDTICNVCERERTITHSYSIQDKDSTSHWMKCAFCGEIDETTRSTHSFDNNCDTSCNGCNFTRSITHDYSVQDKDTASHWMKCSICGTIDKSTVETHGYDNTCDTTCDECGHVRTITHDYSVQDKNTETHWMKCSVCGDIDESTRKAHDYDNNCDTTCDECGHVRQVPAHKYDNACDTSCNECGYVRSITHDYSVQDKSETEHWMKCSVCGTIDESTRENHGYDNTCDTSCDECGHVRTITHDYSVQDKNTETHWMKCSVCGDIDESTRKAHDYDNNCDTTCDECGFERKLYILGDLDDNGEVDLNDAIYLLYHVNFPGSYPVNQPCDFDGSGEVDLNDAIYLLYHVNFPSSYPLH